VFPEGSVAEAVRGSVAAEMGADKIIACSVIPLDYDRSNEFIRLGEEAAREQRSVLGMLIEERAWAP
jgi:hypothetical protein